MNEYTASNGIKVRSESHWSGQRRIFFEGELPGGVLEMSGEQMKALIEALEHERDEELGRWRWPEHPDYVVYPRENGSVTVFDESSPTAAITFWRSVRSAETTSGSFNDAARAYFDAHPEPKPWAEAKDGEVWVVDGKYPAMVRRSADGVSAYFESIDPGNPWGHAAEHAKHARRIFPESV